jgi:hypothetical protein
MYLSKMSWVFGTGHCEQTLTISKWENFTNSFSAEITVGGDDCPLKAEPLKRRVLERRQVKVAEIASHTIEKPPSFISAESQ